MASRRQLKRVFKLYDQDVKEEAQRLAEKEAVRVAAIQANKEEENNRLHAKDIVVMDATIEDMNKTITDLVKQLAEARQALDYYDNPDPEPDDDGNYIPQPGETADDGNYIDEPGGDSDLPY